MRRRLRWPLILAIGLAAPGLKGSGGPPTERELAAYLPYDLGPDTVDVSHYPPEQQKNYQLFLKRCTLCHAAARPLNAPLVTRTDWARFVGRMEARLHTGILFSGEERRQVLDFLAHDSQVRKVERKSEFDALQRRLRKRFDEIQKEKALRALHQKTKEPAPYTGAP